MDDGWEMRVMWGVRWRREGGNLDCITLCGAFEMKCSALYMVQIIFALSLSLSLQAEATAIFGVQGYNGSLALALDILHRYPRA